MNREEAKQLLPIIQAFAEGKTVQAKYKGANDTWDDQATILPPLSCDYRIKPEPKPRPWKWDECPKVFIVEWKGDGNRISRIAVKQHGFDHVRFMGGDGHVTQARIPFDELLRDWVRISEDGEASPCGILLEEA